MDAPDPISSDSVRTYLLEELRQVANDFAPGELAYLATTSKVEIQVRDALAWRLHQRLDPGGFTVAREWQRADLVILDGLTAVAVLEAKALYAFDVHSPSKNALYLTKVRADLAKAAALAPEAQAFALVLTTHVDGPVPAHLRKHVVKYSSGIAGALAKHGTADAVHDRAVEIWARELTSLGAPIESVRLDAGQVWGLNIVIDAWLVGPVPRVQLVTTA
jgi:hypothetical protein